MRKKIEQFLTSPARNQWLRTRQMDLYVRKGFHNGHYVLDLATFEVHPFYQRQGFTKRLIQTAKEITPFDGIYIENVLNDYFNAYMQRLIASEPNWIELPGPSYMWLK